MPRKNTQSFPDILSSGDVADLLKVSYQYVERLAKEGRLPSKKIGSGRIFMSADVMLFKKERDRKAKTDPRIKRGR